MYTQDEINRLADLLRRYPRVVVVADEAYAHMVFPPHKPFRYPRPAEHPELAHRTISIFSAGKLLSAVGIRVGFCVAHECLIAPIVRANRVDIECLNAPYQRAVASAFEHLTSSDYFERKCASYHANMRRLLHGLNESPLDLSLWVPGGGYFITSDVSRVTVPEPYYTDPESGQRIGKDSAFVYW